MNTRTTLVLALLALVVAGYLFIIKPWEEKAADTKKPPDVAKSIYDPKPKDIDKVELVGRGGKDKITFKKQADNSWQILEPIQAPANDFEVNGMVDKVGDVKYVKTYSAGDKDRPSDTVSGTSKPTAVIKLYSGSTLKADLLIGSRVPTGTGTYVRTGDSDVIYQASSDLTTAFNKRLDSVRNRNVLKFDLKDVKHVKVEGTRNYELSQPKEGTWVIDAPTRGRGDKEAIEKVVRPISTLYVQDFKDDDLGLRAYQLDKPQLKLTIHTEKQIPPKAKPGDANTKPADTQPSTESKDYALLIGGATDPSATTYFAKLDIAPWIFAVSDSTVKDLSAAVTDLRDKKIASGDNNAQAIGIEINNAGGQMTLTHTDKGDWTFADGTKADSAAVDDLVKTVQNLKSVGDDTKGSSLVTFDWDHPRGKITVTHRGDVTPTTLLIGNPSTGGQFVYIKNQAENSVGLISKADAEQIISPPVAYQDRNVLKFSRDQADKIEITKAGGPITLEKKAEKWSLTTPVSAAADSDAVRNIIADLASLRAKKVVDKGNKAKYGLDKPQVQLVVYTQAPAPRPVGTAPAAPVHRPTASAPTASVTPSSQPAMAKVAEHPTAMTATQPAARRDSRPLDQRIKQLEELIHFQETTERQKGEENPKATAMLYEQLAQLKAQQGTTQPAIKGAPQGPEEATTRPAVSTQPASATTQPAPAPEVKVYRISLSQVNGITYASRDDLPLVYEIDNKIFEDAMAEMRDRQILKFDVANVTHIGFDHDGVQVELRKDGTDWKYVAEPLVAIDNQKVTEVLNVFRDLKTHKYEAQDNADLSKFGLDKDVQRVWVVLEGGQRQEVLLGKKGPPDDKDKSRYATLSGGKSVFLLKDDQAKKFAQKLEDFQKSAATPAAGGAPPAPTGSVQ